MVLIRPIPRDRVCSPSPYMYYVLLDLLVNQTISVPILTAIGHHISFKSRTGDNVWTHTRMWYVCKISAFCIISLATFIVICKFIITMQHAEVVPFGFCLHYWVKLTFSWYLQALLWPCVFACSFLGTELVNWHLVILLWCMFFFFFFFNLPIFMCFIGKNQHNKQQNHNHTGNS